MVSTLPTRLYNPVWTPVECDYVRAQQIVSMESTPWKIF